MKRISFIKSAAVLGTALVMNTNKVFADAGSFISRRPEKSKRNFSSTAVESAIAEFKSRAGNDELGWLFENCFPNTLDTTVFQKPNGPDTYIITGDIDAMWLRDSTAQIWPYLPFMATDGELQNLIAGVIKRQTKNILKDPYANAFYDDDQKISEWKDDVTDMKPGIHERKWEIDSLCYPIRLAYHYWKMTGDIKPFTADWESGIASTLNVFREQQRKHSNGSYSFQRKTTWATDGVPLSGYGYPVKPVGLICSTFRPSDDATVFSFLIPSNFFAKISLEQAAEMIKVIRHNDALSSDLAALGKEVEHALKEHATVAHPRFGKIYAYEVNGAGSFNLMDDANVPGLLSLPYLGAVSSTDPVYLNTRKFLFSDDNLFFYKGTAAEGIGGPHAGIDMIWPISIIMRGLTSNNDAEIKECIRQLRTTHAGTGFMHESFHKNNPDRFTRKWFAWANAIFGEFLWSVYKTKPGLLIPK